MQTSNGRFVWEVDENGEEVARPTEETHKEIEKVRTKAKYIEAGLPLDKFTENRFMHKLKWFDQYDETISNGVESYLSNFIKHGKSVHLYIHGPQNTGKTTVVSMIGQHLIECGFSVKYMVMNKLLSLLQKSQFDDEHESDIEKLMECDLLILDQCFQDDQVTIYKSGYQIPFLDTFLKTRVEIHDKTTIFVSNVDKVAISDSYKSIVNFVQRKTESVLFDKVLDMPDNLGSRIWK